MSAAAVPTEFSMIAYELRNVRTAEHMLGHLRFAEARAAHIDAVTGLYENNPMLTRMLVEAGRAVVFFTLLTLDAARCDDDRTTWPTIGLLQQTVEPFGVTSKRRVHDLVRRLVETGYIESRLAAADRRVRLLVPSEKMLAHHRNWLKAYYEPLEVLFPEPGYGPVMRHDRAFQTMQLALGRHLLGYAARMMGENAVMAFFMSREAGAIILIKLLQLAWRQSEGAEVTISFTDFGHRFGVSRTHVRHLLKDAQQHGYIALSDNRVAVLPVATAAFDRFLADSMVGNDFIFRLVTQEREPAPGLPA